MINYVMVDAMGLVVMTGACTGEELKMQRAPQGMRLVQGIGRLGLDYVQGESVMPRPALPARIDGSVLRGVPAGALITIDTSTYTADGTDIRLVFDLPGTYTIRVQHPPYLDWEGIAIGA